MDLYRVNQLDERRGVERVSLDERLCEGFEGSGFAIANAIDLVPEPSSMVLCCLGALSLMLRRKR